MPGRYALRGDPATCPNFVRKLCIWCVTVTRLKIKADANLSKVSRQILAAL